MFRTPFLMLGVLACAIGLYLRAGTNDDSGTTSLQKTSVSTSVQAPSATHAGTGTETSPEKAQSSQHISKGDDGPKWTDTVGTIATALATIFAAYSAYLARQTIIQANLAEKERAAAARADRLTSLWNDIQRFSYLTDAQMSNLADPQVVKIVLYNVNLMEKVAFLWNADLVDRTATEDEVRPFYTKLYDQIGKLGRFPSLNRTGARLLEENPTSRKLYTALKRAPVPVTTPGQRA